MSLRNHHEPDSTSDGEPFTFPDLGQVESRALEPREPRERPVAASSPVDSNTDRPGKRGDEVGCLASHDRLTSDRGYCEFGMCGQ